MPQLTLFLGNFVVRPDPLLHELVVHLLELLVLEPPLGDLLTPVLCCPLLLVLVHFRNHILTPANRGEVDRLDDLVRDEGELEQNRDRVRLFETSLSAFHRQFFDLFAALARSNDLPFVSLAIFDELFTLWNGRRDVVESQRVERVRVQVVPRSAEHLLHGSFPDLFESFDSVWVLELKAVSRFHAVIRLSYLLSLRLRDSFVEVGQIFVHFNLLALKTESFDEGFQSRRAGVL